MPVIHKDSVIFLAGHRGMVGSAVLRRLRVEGYGNIITRTHAELDLTDQRAVRNFFRKNPIHYVVLAAARVGGILANNTYSAEFIYQNLMIESNVIHEAFSSGVRRLLFLGSSCIYPKCAKQPMREEELLSGYLEPTNEPYAVAKIAGIKLCESYNRQYGTNYRSIMPTNLYGQNDNFDLMNSHVLPALIRKFHLAKLAAANDWAGIHKDESLSGPIHQEIIEDLRAISSQGIAAKSTPPSIRLWGTGKPRREFLNVDDLASACCRIMTISDQDYHNLCSPLSSEQGKLLTVSHINVGAGKDISIYELAFLIKDIVGFHGDVHWDKSKPDGAPRKLLDISRLSRSGWQPRVSLSEGIRNTYLWYLQQT